MPIPNKLTEEDKAEMKRLREAGWPEYKIAAKFGVAPGTVRWALGKRPKTHREKLENLDRAKFIALLRASRGRTDTVARLLEVDADTMIDWVAERVMAR